MLESLLHFSNNPWLILLAVMVSTFMLEDFAIIGAALLAVSGKIAPDVAFFAVCMGMMIGDTALYLFGRLAYRWHWLQTKLQRPMIQRQVVALQRAPWQQLALIRCMPGIRTFGYIACGVARVPVTPFTIANVVSIILWAAALFGAAFFLGQRYAENMHEWLWWAMPIALVVFILGQRKIKSNMESVA